MSKPNIRYFLFSFCMMIMLSTSIALAQTIIPNLISTQPVAKVGTTYGVTEDDPLLTAPMTPEAIQKSYLLREKERQRELVEGGFKWMPWKNAGQQILDFIKQRDPELKTVTGDPRFRDIAFADVDGDKALDVITYDWTECVANGCPVTIYFSNKIQKPVNFTVIEIKPFKQGVSVDGTYFEF